MLPSLERSGLERSTVKRFKVKARLTLILSLYLVLAIIYSIITPIGRGADEWAHYWYAQFIAQHGRLPLNPAEREAAGYKSDWPPLYHLSAAAVTAWIDTAGPPTFKYRNDPDHIRRQMISAPRAEAILHTEDELFPWQQEILVWRLGRLLSITFSLGTLLVTYKLALEIFSRSREAGERGSRGGGAKQVLFPLSPQTLALACTASLAFIPRFLFTGMLFNYDSLTLLLASLFLWLVIRIAKGYYPRWGFWALGGLAGLALLTKYLTALLPFEIVLLAFVRGAGGQRGRETFPAPMLRIGQALLAFSLVTVSWFGYLLVNFNEIETYGPILGTVAPLLRGDGSDRTVEQIFAAMSGGQAPPPAQIDQQTYAAGQLAAEFLITFWFNPLTRPSSLNWLVGIMTLIAAAAMGGLIFRHWTAPASASWPLVTTLLWLHCLLPLPFMLVRLFGARDALEAVQGRHVLFLAGPAIVILLILGWSSLTYYAAGRGFSLRRLTPHALHFTLYALLGLLLTGAMLQLVSMKVGYPPPLPVRTTPNPIAQRAGPPDPISLPGGATLTDIQVIVVGPALRVAMFWQGGSEPAPEDYQLELALVDPAEQTRANWLAYQTQARYPTRAWEPGDTIRDEGWLPLLDLPAGEYQLRWRLLGETGELFPWQNLPTYTVNDLNPSSELILWRQGQITHRPPLLRERETAQITLSQPPGSALQLLGPDGVAHPPVSRGETWANFIIGPDWLAGEYRWQDGGETILRVEENERNFQMLPLSHPLEADFAGQVKLLGYDLPTRRVQPGEGLPLILYWQGLRWMGEDFVIFERLLDNQGIAWGGYDRRAKENYSTLFWAPGEIVTDGFAVPVDPAAPPGVYHLSLGWYRQVAGQADSLVILDPETGEPGGSTAVTIGPIKVGGPPPGVAVPAAAPQTEIKVRLGEQIKLLGFDLTDGGQTAGESSLANPPTFSSSDSLHLTLYWQCLAAPASDYTVFVHVRTPAGETVAQKDNPPAAGAYPTSLWEAGEIIKDEISIPLETLESGPYEVVVGLYDFTTGMRLPAANSPDGVIRLGSFEIIEK